MKWLLMLLLTLPVLADDLSEIRALMGRGLDERSLRYADGWGICGEYYFLNGRREAEGTALLHRMDGRWQCLISAGGAMDAGSAYKYGLPQRLWQRLRIPTDHQSAVEILSQGPYWKHLSTTKIGSDTLQNGRAWERVLMRNEIFARHGHVFADLEMRNYFSQRPWYRPGHETPLNQIERWNVQTLLDYDRNHPEQRYLK